MLRLVSPPRAARDDRGQDLVEYALVAALVALVAIAGAVALSGALHRLYGETAGKVKSGASFVTNSSTPTTDCAKRDESPTPDATAPPPQTDEAPRTPCK
jgi:Flp pilus assembly pilin Flp